MDKITELYQKARGNVDPTSSVIDEMSDAEISQLVHELWGRQIELEIRNEELRKLQAQFEAAQRKYADLYDFAPTGYCLFDRDGLIREVNLVFAEYLGVERGNLLNTRFDHYIFEEDRENFSQHLRSLFVTKVRQRCEIRLIHSSGDRFHVRLESIAGPEGEDYVNYCKTTIIEVTEDKRKEKELRENEERLHQVIQTLPVMITAFDENLHFIVWNRECERVTGYSAEEIVGNPNARELLYPDSNYRQRILTALIDEGKFGNFRNWEWETTCKDGKIKTIAWSSVSKHYWASGWYGWAIGEEGFKQSRDELEGLMQEHTFKLTQTTQQLQQEMAERKLFEQALQTSQRQYRLLVEHVADGIAIIQEGKLIFANKALISIPGFPGDQLLGMDPISLVHSEHREHFQKILSQFKGGDAPQRFQIPFLTKGGREVWIEGDLSGIEWEGASAILMTIRDITDRKIREMAMEQEQKRLQNRISTLKATIKDRYKFGDIIGKSVVMQEVYDQILKASTSDANIFIYGESGTGKELVARTIHKMSKRRDQRFVPVNCGAIPESLFESEFFGHRKGSFTGAFRDKQGFFSAAHKGALFLDELGELTPTMQVKLLRVLDDGEYTPIGETTIKKADVRIIAATNRNVDDMRKRGLIREDFFFRIHVFTITAPPLRERKEDIPLLVDHFLSRYSSGEPLPTIPGEIMEMLYNYDWPGNVREFQNALQRYLSGQSLNLDSRKSESVKTRALSNAEIQPGTGEFHEVTEDFEKKLILSVLEQHRWNKSKVAATLGIPRRTLYRKMEKYGII
jgi:PAS domain S-box-containing protein